VCQTVVGGDANGSRRECEECVGVGGWSEFETALQVVTRPRIQLYCSCRIMVRRVAKHGPEEHSRQTHAPHRVGCSDVIADGGEELGFKGACALAEG